MRLKRGRKARQNAPVDGGEHCDKCGQVVQIEADGRCRLGHRVGTPLSALSEPFGGSGDAFDTTTDVFGSASEAFPGYEPAFGDAGPFDDYHGEHDLDPYEPDADPLTATELFAAATQGSALDGFSPAAPPASHDAVSPPPRETSEGRPANPELEHPYDQVLSWEEIPGTELTAPADSGWPGEEAPAAFAFSPVSALDGEAERPVTERFVFDPLGEDPAR
jgi:hypothetical protein